MKKGTQSALRQFGLGLVALGVVYGIGQKVFTRFDLTHDKRYTLSEATLAQMDMAVEPLVIDVFLEGSFPGEFRKLQNETRQLLEEFKAYNPSIRYRFVDPLSDDEAMNVYKREWIYDLFRMDNPMISDQDKLEIKKSIEEIPDLDKALMETFTGAGMNPARISVNDKGKQSEAVLFPWAIVKYGDRVTKVPLLKNMMGANTAEKVNSSVQHLEYAFAQATKTVVSEKKQRIAVLKGNGQMHDLLMADFIKSVRENYYIGTFTLDSVAKSPKRSLEALQKYDLMIVAKPTEAFTEEEKQVLDQYIVRGGKSLWLVEEVAMEMDSLYNETGSTLAFPRSLNLADMFFRYGVRINPKLVKDAMATPISLATGEPGSATQYMQYPWLYAPMVYAQTEHPIVANMDAMRFDFTNSIDTLANGVKKTVLLSSSPYTMQVGTPTEISLAEVQDQPDPENYKTGTLPLAVLLEGNFTSTFHNRILPFDDAQFVGQGKNNQMIVVADGDIIRNQLDKNYRPLELGFDKWTNTLYANKEFLLNSVNYLLDDAGLLELRNKNVELPLLDPEKVYANYSLSQWITVGIPLGILALAGLAFTQIRKRRYSK